MGRAFFLTLITLFVSLYFFYRKYSDPKVPHVLRLHMKSEPKTLDPRKGRDRYSSQMHALFFEGLVKLYPDGSIQFAQAKSCETSQDNLTYVFHLRDTFWSDKTPVTAYDFEQSWKDVLNPKFHSPGAQLLFPIRNAERAKNGLVPLSEVGVKAIDAKTLEVNLERPVPYFFELLSFPIFAPIQIENSRRNPNWAEDLGSNFICNGPYMLDSWNRGHQITAVHNPNYRKTQDLRAGKIIFTIVKNDQLTLEMFEKGMIDVIGDSLTTLPLYAIPRLEKKWIISNQSRPSTLFISFNVDKIPFNHPKIRKAFSYAINRQELIESEGRGVKKNISTDHISPAYKASSAATNLIPPCLKENRCRFFFKDNDVEQAKILLEEGMRELGVSKDIFDSVVLYFYSRTSGSRELLETIQKQWLNALGVFIKIQYLDSTTVMDKVMRGDYFLCFMRWVGIYKDPMCILERFKHKEYVKNYANWENQEYIQLLDRSSYEKEDMRLQTLEKAEKLLLNEMPIAPIYHEDFVYIINPSLGYEIPLWGDRLLLPSSLNKQRYKKRGLCGI